ncbi:hypothetical protein IQ781_27480 (plasmid) [Bacillus sp. N447-1]|uniref:hypothetical protein n=1 Tax=Bacillus sp. N447-1 TaxID=2789208 RepID=UPI001F6045B9|nr:hypothetical protein [Bacillus sp. N447-1]UNT71719.1 hypothetical protein IQ781_27480 [Bacillus sp. N447-1]
MNILSLPLYLQTSIEFSHKNIKTVTASIQSTVEEKIVGRIPEAGAILYATEKEGELTNFKLQVDGRIIFFPKWMHVSNQTYYPQLYYSDINHDGKKEISIVLTTGCGSEVIIQEVHVFNIIKNKHGELFKEIPVDNSISIINKNVQTKLTKSEAIIKIGNDITKINIKKLGIEPAHIFSNIAFGSILKFKVVNNKLNAIVGATVAPSGGYLGDIYITYTFKDNEYKIGQINFISSRN